VRVSATIAHPVAHPLCECDPLAIHVPYLEPHTYGDVKQHTVALSDTVYLCDCWADADGECYHV
jgi:hypothetical protein